MSRLNWAKAPDTGNPELNRFLDDLLNVVKEIDRQALNALTQVGESASPTYTGNEQTMLNNLKTAVNGILNNT